MCLPHRRQVVSRLFRRYQPQFSAREKSNLRATQKYVMGELLELKVALYKQYLDQCSSDPSGMQL